MDSTARSGVFLKHVAVMNQRSYFFNAIGTAGLKMSTAKSYWGHVNEYIQFIKRNHDTDRPSEVGVSPIAGFLKFLYERHHASAKTRNQALSALRFLYEIILKCEWNEDAMGKLRAKTSSESRRTLISKPDVGKLLSVMPNPYRMLFSLCYAGAMRTSCAIQLRVKDLIFDEEAIAVCDCKHDHFRTVPFPKSLHERMRRQVESVRVICEHDKDDNPNGVPLPDARRRKAPHDAHSLSWYWCFPSGNLSRDPETGFFGRNHVDKKHAGTVFRNAVRKAGIDRRITPHDLRRTAATRMHFEMGMPLARLQYILGHNSLEQTREYILEDEFAINGSMSPFDGLGIN